MNKYYLILILIIILTNCGDEVQSDSNLEYVDEFTSFEERIFFAYNNFIIDTKESLIVSDLNDAKVVEVSYDGNLIRSYGKKGRGPGEFELPSHPLYNDGKLFVYDGGAKILVFEKSGQYLDEFRIEDFIFEITTDGKHFFAFSAREGEDGLIKVYDMEGKFVKSFGDVLESEDSNLNNLPKMMVYDNKLWVLHLYHPVLKVYSLDGKLLNEYRLNEVFDYQERNEEKTRYTPEYSNLSGTTVIFKSITVNEEGVYLGLYNNNDDLIVDYFDHKLNPVRRYSSSMGNNDFFHFHSVVVDSNVFVSGANPETGIYKFKFKE